MQTLLVTIDALRADHLAQYGYDRDTMPVLDRLDSEGVRFASAFANGPYTRVSIPAMHTSNYLAYANIEDLPTIASVLGDADVTTACIGTRTGFLAIEGDLVFDEYVDFGHDEFHERANQQNAIRNLVSKPVDDLIKKTNIGPYLASTSSHLYDYSKAIYDRIAPFRYLGYTSAEHVTDRAIDWLGEHTNEDFFLWIHYMEAHRPYGVHDPEQEYVTGHVDEQEIMRLMKSAGRWPDDVTVREHRLLKNLYDSDLRYCSKHMDRLFDALEDNGIWHDANIFFTSDHGEEFYEHGKFYHRNLPYDELIHVPLFVKTPETNDEVVEEQRELLDLAPTICEEHDVQTETIPFRGKSLFESGDREVVSLVARMAVYDVEGAQDERFISSGEQAIAVRWDDWKYIWTGDQELLFDLRIDPRERDSVADANPDVVDRIVSRIPTDVRELPGEQLRDPVDHADREQLEALGYLELENR